MRQLSPGYCCVDCKPCRSESRLYYVHALPTKIRYPSIPIRSLKSQEPHGMIVEGMVSYLPRPHFHVTVCAVGGAVSSALEAGADRVVRLPLVLEGARLALEQLQ